MCSSRPNIVLTDNIFLAIFNHESTDGSRCDFTGVQPGSKVLLMASSATTVNAIREGKSNTTLASFDHEARVAQMRQSGGGNDVVLPKGQREVLPL